MIEYVAKRYTALFPIGIIAKGDVLTPAQLTALGPATVAELEARGIIAPGNGAVSNAREPEPEGHSPTPPPAESGAARGRDAASCSEEESEPEPDELAGLDDLMADGEAPGAQTRKGRRKAK